MGKLIHKKVQWKNGYYEGNVDSSTGEEQDTKGKFVWKNGTKFEGEFWLGEMKKGVVTYPNGDWYKGWLKKGVFHSSGYKFSLDEYHWSNGSQYQGNFANGKRNGYGCLTFADGDRYCGEWLNGLANGEGKYTFNDGEEVCGIWKDGVFENSEYEIKIFPVTKPMPKKE